MGTEELLKSFKKSDLFGSKISGKQFDDTETCCKNVAQIPTSIIIRKGVIIDNLTFVYKGYRAVHGGGGGAPIETQLSQDDYIVKASGTCSRFANQKLIEILTFTTKKGNVISTDPSFTGEYDFEYIAEKGHAIYALFGCAGDFLNSIGFYTVQQDFKMPEINANISEINANIPGIKFG